MTDGWTVAQAAFVLDEPVDSFRRVVERGPVKKRIVRSGGLRARSFDLADLVFLYAERELKAELTPKGRGELYEALVRHSGHGANSEVTFGHLRFDFGQHLKQVESKLKDLRDLSNEIDVSSGDALIKGTRIEVYRLAAVLDGGMTARSVLDDYPSLNERQLLAAKTYAKVNPKVGRPYPKMTAKAALRGSGLDAL